MATKQGSLDLLQDPIAQELLQSTTPARLAYVSTDGTPRIIPIWFHWNGREIVFGTPPTAPKVRMLARNGAVAVTIDSTTWPYKVLQIRGTARVEIVDGVAPEYASAAARYFGPEQGQAWVSRVGGMFSKMARITVTPQWAAILDFETRFPSAIEAAMAGR
jgi:PPOX class probable F420-dependent enzyme